jgi:hypothetical protein
MIDTTIEIYSSNSQAVNVYDSTTGKTIFTPSLTIGYRERNTSTSLVLHGDSAFNYGQDLLTNVLHLTENFCNTTPPVAPVTGQKFYNSNTKTLSIYDGDWKPIIITENTDPLDIVYISDFTSKHSDFTLSNFLDPLIPMSGNSEPVAITLSGIAPVDDNEAVTKAYADSVLVVPSPYLPRTGYVEMQGPLLVADTARSDDADTVVNIKYVNELGIVDTVSDNRFPGTVRVTPWYATAWFHGKIIDTASDAEIILPISFIVATSSSTNYGFSAVAVCTSVESNVKLNVTFVDGSRIRIKRDGTTGEVKFSGNIYGFVART